MARDSEENFSSLKMDPGPHIGRIVSNVDPHRQGAVQVELLRGIGNQRSMDQQVFTVRYASPSFGSTDVEHNASNADDHHSSQQSHGFWSPPPNTGSMVLCVFIGGDPGQGYYFSSIQDQHMNQTVPGIASSKNIKKTFKSYNPDTGDWSKITDTSSLSDQPNTQYPTAEGNRPKDGIQPNTTAQEKPVNSARVSQLAEQGLIDDPYRGTHSSSARRESPSNVHGWSTPGPLDKTPGAPTRSVGPRDTQVTKHTARRPGHSFIMDDGDESNLRKSKAGEGPAEYANLQKNETGGDVTVPKDQQIRITAANGAQFIMHCAEDFIHIHNSKGTAWIEMTSNGKIDIYTADCVSIHTEADYNITSDRDVNIHAGRAINLYADHDINAHSKSEMHIKSDSNIAMSASTHIAVNAEGGDLTIMSDGTANMISGDIRLDSRNIDVAAHGHIHLTSGGNTEIRAESIAASASIDIDILAAGTINQTSATQQLKTYSAFILKSDGTIDQRSDGLFSTSGSDMSQTSDGPIAISADGGDLRLQGTSNVYLNSGPGRKKGALTVATDPFNASLDATATAPISAGAAKQANEAMGRKPHPAKITADPITHTIHTNYGRAITSRVPLDHGSFKGFENLNPPGHTQDLTDRHNADQPYAKDEERRQISNNDDLENIPNGTRKPNPNVSGARRNPYPHHPSPKGDPSSNIVSPESQISDRNTPSDWVQDQEFMGDVSSLSSKLGITVPELLSIFAAETGTDKLDPSKTNGDGCVGLVQICKQTNPKTGKTTFDELAARNPKEAAEDLLSPEGMRKLSRHRQMFWIDKYFDLILPGGAGMFPKEDRVVYIWLALAAGTDSSKLITKKTIYPFADTRCKQNKGWQDTTQNNDCTVKKAGTWLRWYEKQFIVPKLGAKSYSPDLSSGPGSTIQPSSSASVPPPGNSVSNWPASSQNTQMPSDSPGVPNSTRWAWYNGNYIAVDATGTPVDSAGNQVGPDAAYSKPQVLEKPSAPATSTRGLPATKMAGGNPDGSSILTA